MQHDPIRQLSLGALYTVPEEEEKEEVVDVVGSAARSPGTDPGDWRHSFSDASASTRRHSFSDAAGAQSKQDPATGPARASDAVTKG